jgi:hypothetical protein
MEGETNTEPKTEVTSQEGSGKRSIISFIMFYIVNQQAKEENMVEGPDGQMISKKALKKLQKKLEKDAKKEESML